MAVRRLHHVQPESFAFSDETLAFAEACVKKYPEGRQASAVIPLLWQVQLQEGWVSEPAIRAIADYLAMPYIRVLEVATFYTMFQLAPVGRKAHIQVCGTTPCMLRGSEDLLAVCKRRISPHAFELSADGDFSWEEVECLGACVNAPMIQIVKDTYEDLTPESFEAILDTIAAGDMPTPGPQNGRHFSAAAGGATTLTDPDLYRRRPAPAQDDHHDDVMVAEAPPASTQTPTDPATPEARAQNAGRPGGEERTEEEIARTAGADLASGDETVPDEFKPALMSAPREGTGDDLKLIWGVGPKLETLLHELGVYHFDQIAGWNEMNLRWIDQHLGAFRGRAVRDKWIEQAGRLSGGWRPTDKDGEKRPEERHGRTERFRPDDDLKRGR
ncbi:NADH-quinone oxidoreductase subunit NuoE [Methylobrevis pamukkalensis]|uniref:NADH-quinone oxidoreductase chain 2 n=1 Tax=Methylobrevis pamukkalensis TaxID=1439726 RepID=A0A1E3H812_9HYPH|nr:NADH-quinone oxidoreductase subunit NuoE [Methylobrevis pamukkalensis]ODN72468.1 NADH-quinone oxidoreductase chain 2 [Methylobrevis pamukkalensis]